MHQERYVPALDDLVQIVKSPSGAYAIRADGRRLSLPALREATRAAHRARSGALVPGFHEHLRALPADEVVKAALYFEPDLPWRELAPRLYATTPDVAEAARAELIEAITEQGAELADRLRARGLIVTAVGRRMPVVLARGPASTMLDLREERQLRMVTGAEPQVPELRCNGGADKRDGVCHVDVNVFHGVDAAFNEAGYYGAGQRVAIFEDVGNCTLNEQHEAFQHVAGVVYSNPTPEQCAASHGTNVASVISGSNDGVRCGAAEVELYYPNAGTPEFFPATGESVLTSICNINATLTAYDWMSSIADPPLSAVNESYGCMHQAINCDYHLARQWEGITQDYFARVYDMTIVKAAGNRNCGVGQEACPWSLNSICVGSMNSAGSMSCFSSTANPGSEYEALVSDREEPDLVALGGETTKDCPGPFDEEVCLASFETPEGWVGFHGTSYAAPAVTSMLTLYREACEPSSGDRLSQRALRALARVAAWGGNPADAAYSTPTPSDDHLDGGGLLMAKALLSMCGDGSNGGTKDVVIDLEGGEPGPMPEAPSPYQDDWSAPGETQSFVGPLDYGYQPGPSSGRKWAVFQEGDFPAGSRLRVTWSWDGCALSDTGFAPAGVSVDFDLFLYSPTLGYVWGSQSLDDNNEGFDYTIPAGEGGRYQIILAWPDGSTGCETGSTTEPGAYAWAFFGP